ncbi:MAG: 1-acyl-sn-glycerol-3-phosphate acyltransferase [Bacteroidota bacterium]
MSTYSKLYRVLRYIIVKPMISGFYRHIQIKNYDKVPIGKPVIFAANHQNALIDALNVIYAVDHRRQVTFLTRADVFNHRFKHIMLGLFKMLPVYRQRDNLPNIRELNADIFNKSVAILDRDDVILLFPEGNHDRTQRIRPLKKGIVRIGFQAAVESDFAKDIYIVPIGLNYTNHLKFHRDLLITFGDPISLKKYYAQYQQNESRALTDSLKEIRASIGEQIINIRNREYYPLIRGLQQLYAPQLSVARGAKKNDLEAHLRASQEIAQSLEAYVEEAPEEAAKFQAKYEEYEAGLKELKIRDHTLERAPHGLLKIFGQELLLLIGLPLFLLGVLNNYLPYRISWWLARKNFKDDHFHSSITALSAYFLFPIFFFIQTMLAWAITGKFWMAMVYLALIMIAGRFAIRYSEWFKKWWASVQHFRFRLRKHPTLSKITEIRTELLSWVKGVMTPEEKTTESQQATQSS